VTVSANKPLVFTTWLIMLEGIANKEAIRDVAVFVHIKQGQ